MVSSRWSGSWKIVVEATGTGKVHVSGGLNDFDAPYELAAGTVLVLPVFTGCYTSEGFGEMSRTWHDYELRHVLSNRSRPGGSPSFPSPVSPGGLALTRDLPPLRRVLYNRWGRRRSSLERAKRGRASRASRRDGSGAVRGGRRLVRRPPR